MRRHDASQASLALSPSRLLPVGMVMVGMVLVVEGMVARVVVAAVMVVVMVVAVAMEVVAATHPGVPSVSAAPPAGLLAPMIRGSDVLPSQTARSVLEPAAACPCVVCLHPSHKHLQITVSYTSLFLVV